MIIGLDDTDSRSKGMCTTYLATLIAEKASKYGSIENRLLVRLNPNIPYKTRGNACLCLVLDTKYQEKIKDITIEMIKENAILEDSDPGVAFMRGNKPPKKLQNYTIETVKYVKNKKQAENIAEENNIEIHSLGKEGKGIIGALAAIGAPMAFDDWTYELLAYRDKRWGEKRKVEMESFFKADEITYPKTWDTVDYSTGDVIAVPNTKGPVVYGIRGTFSGVWKANSVIEAEADHINLYKTNQGTDNHLIESEIGEVNRFKSYIISGEVSIEPNTIEGGHVFFYISDNEESLKCAAFEPTKQFRDIVKSLRKGDEIKVCGGIKKNTLNIEKIYIKNLKKQKLVNPECSCGKKMESAGKNQGYRCRDCGATASSKIKKKIQRDLEEGWYEVPPSARRHISKPLVRFDSNKNIHCMK